jgi:hypothetical protein
LSGTFSPSCYKCLTKTSRLCLHASSSEGRPPHSIYIPDIRNMLSCVPSKITGAARRGSHHGSHHGSHPTGAFVAHGGHGNCVFRHNQDRKPFSCRRSRPT